MEKHLKVFLRDTSAKIETLTKDKSSLLTKGDEIP